MKEFIKKLVPTSALDAYHSIWPVLGATIYRNPSKSIKVIGITGTNGKTTVVHLCSYLLENAGYKTASISSLRFKVGNKEWPNKLKMTMPGRMKLQRFLRQAVDAGCEFAVVEVTSEGVKQNRHKFVEFDTAVFTNLTPEHIESHGSFEKYKSAKGLFFSLPHRVSIVNLDDENADYFLNFSATEKIGYGFRKNRNKEHSSAVEKSMQLNNRGEIRNALAESYKLSEEGISFMFEGREFKLPILGEFNIYNSLAAICIGISQNIKLDDIQKIIETFPGVPGRVEIVIGEPFSVVVDYAHTPDSLEKFYQTIRNFKKQETKNKQIPNSNDQNSRMICVLGAAGGGRDKWKRPKLGELAKEYCDEIILTDEDPYTENPADILKDIEVGFSKKTQYKKILDRREAIREALKKAKGGDIVAITGKGAEPLMVVKKGPIPWDDREVVREEFKKLYF